MKIRHHVPHIFNRQNVICVILILICWLLFYLPLILHINYDLVDNDWYQSYYYGDTFRKIILEYQQFPLRTPFIGGGYPIVGHPFDVSLSPLSILILIFGAVRGSTIIALLLSLLGVLGMFYLTKAVLKYSHMGALFSTLVFMFCKWGLNMMADGNYQKLYYWLLPWLVAFFIKSKENRKFIIFSGFILYLIIVQGGLILIPLILFMFLFSFLQCIGIKKGHKPALRIRPMAVFILIMIFTLCLSAVKIIPMRQLLEARARFIHLPCEDSYSAISLLSKATQKSLNWSMLYEALLNRDFYESPHAMYLGYIPLFLCILAVILYPRQTWRHFLLLIIFTFIEMGSNAPIDIFKWIWNVHPLIHGIWKLNKYFTIFIFFLISLIGGRFFLVFNKIPRQRQRSYLIGVGLLLLVSTDMITSNRIYYDIPSEICFRQVPEESPQKSFFQIKLTESYKDKGLGIIEDIRSYRAIWYLLRQNVGLVNFKWEGNIKIDESAIPKYIIPTMPTYEIGVEDTAIPLYELDGNIYKGIFANKKNLIPQDLLNTLYRGEVFFLNNQNKAVLQLFSPNKIHININAQSPDTLVINQNYHKSWESNKGKVANYRGLLAVEIEEIGRSMLELNYFPSDFYAGLIISLCAFIFAIYFLLFSGKSPRNIT